MEIDSLQEALRDFDKKAKTEECPLLEQFLCHIAKTGETLVQWTQFKNYFLFKLENVLDDFRASAPEQRGIRGNSIYDPALVRAAHRTKRNYTGTDKFLRGVEKNVMVVSCIHPTSEKNGCSAVSRMNGVMLPGNTSLLFQRVNGPGTPRPLNRPKLSLANSLSANGLPDSTDNKDLDTEHEDDKDSSEVSASGSLPSSVKNKHPEEAEEDMEAEQQEVKRLKFSKDDEEEEDEEDEEDEQEADTLRPLHATCQSKEAEAMVQEEDEEDKAGYRKDKEASSSAAPPEDQEPSSSTQAEACSGSGAEAEQAEREVPCGSQEEGNDMDQTEQQAPVLEGGDAAREDVAPSSSTSEPPTEGAMESATLNTGTTEEPMEQD
ncbi:hypothetical protein KUCAC02_031188 [Chaenocephalus aceratus]|uniref:Uncharacterized protein n=1 Tax=Chaenocephalus aceratus TaxID=36190 RepID=A0ACB9XN50_CHAAC|nr:hypothetical protein KUCAC02_031188 [Chaenocephalus aceratus]